MLSRNAERLYWLGRYVERVEDTARLLSVFSHVMLDLPKSKKISWEFLLRIMAAEQPFHEHYEQVNEYNVMYFLLSDANNAGSIRSSVKAARENARTSRDIIPLEGWEILNELNLLVKHSMDEATRRRHHYPFLAKVIARCQQFNGMIANSMSRDQAYDFLTIGALIERADMTTRILDVATGILLRRSEDENAFDALLWLEVLKTTNALTMYRALNGPKVTPQKVVYFLLCTHSFPRSIRFCLLEIESLVFSLPRNESFFIAWDALNFIFVRCDQTRVADSEELHLFFDDVQKGLMQLNNVIAETWFPEAFDSQQEQQQSA